MLRPIMGAIFHPRTQEMFIGVVGSGAVLINERLAEFQKLPPSDADRPTKAIIVTHFSVESPEKSLPLLTSLLRDATVYKDSTQRVLMLGPVNWRWRTSQCKGRKSLSMRQHLTGVLSLGPR